MKSLKSDITTKAYEIGRNTSIIAEAVQTDIAYKFAEIVSTPNVKAGSVDEAFAIMEQNTRDLLNTALAGFSEISGEVGDTTSKLFQNSLKKAKTLVRIDPINETKEYLFRITGDQLIENQKIVYKNGRKIGYKEYVEMATRTRIQHELLDQEKQFGEITKQLFYVCDTYSDCANDHLDFQGKLYYDAKVWSSIPRTNEFYYTLQKGVQRCTASVEDVTTKAPYLCTRPNCRHRLIPIAIDDVVTLPLRDILKENKAVKGNYTKSQIKQNYDDTQRQRQIEFGIRKAKRNIEILQKAYDKTKDPDYLKAINRSAYSVRMGQAKMRTLISSNPSLKRDYRRENPYHLQKDLGVAYNSVPIRAGTQFKKSDLVDAVEWQKGIDSTNVNEFRKTIEFIDKSEQFLKSLNVDEKRVLRQYAGTSYTHMNQLFYDKSRLLESIRNDMEKYGIKDQGVFEKTVQKVDDLHKLFAKVREANLSTDKALVTYRGGRDLIGDENTTIIFNSFTSSSINPDVANDFILTKVFDPKNTNKYAKYKIIIPPKSQNQMLYYGLMNEDEVLIDTNSVYDVIGQEQIELTYGRANATKVITQYTLLLRPKPAGIKR